MDLVRPAPPSKKISRWVFGGVALLVVVITTLRLSHMQPAAPSIDRSTLVIETVHRGPLTREVRGSGTLTPEEVRWLAAATDARVDRILIQPGSEVRPDSVIIELSDPQQEQRERDATWQLRAAEADLQSMRAQLDGERLDHESSLDKLRSDYEQARLHADADAELERQGLAAVITKKLSETTAADLQRRLEIEQRRLSVDDASRSARLAAQQAQVEQRRSLLELEHERSSALHVRAGIAGVLEQIDVQAGQRVAAGSTLAHVAEPGHLKGTIHIPEIDAKDIALGQTASIDTRNGIAAATVMRIDPAVRDGAVTVDLRIDGPLPPGARPDLSIDGSIELEKLADVFFLTRPVGAREGAAAFVFKVTGGTAERVPVVFGHGSASAIEVRKGLSTGDQVIVSDTSAFDRNEQIRLN